MRRPRAFPTWVLTAVAATAWVIVDPPTPDLAAHEYRAELVRHVGLGIWEQGWYGGHHVPAYSVLMPPLAALLSPQIVAALAAVISAACFERLARAHWSGPAATAASVWFAIGIVSTLLGGQLAFVAGVAPALGALLAARRDHRWLAAWLGALTTLTSPVAAAFLVLAAAAWWLDARPRMALWVTGGAVVPGLMIALAFPQGGMQPFSFSSFGWSFVAAAVLIIVLPRDERALRWGAILYGAALLAAVAVDTPLGGNLVRMAALFGGPLAAGALWNRHMIALAVIALPLLYWQWLAPVRSVIRGAGDRSSKFAYHAPLIKELDRLQAVEGPERIEIPFTANHWETRFVPPRHELARGWERQLDVKLNPLFYDHSAFSPARYRRWLDDMAVGYVALPDVELDPAGAREGHLVRDGLVPGLREVWHNRHWRLYRVDSSRPLATPPVRVRSIGSASVTLTTPRPATTTVRVRFTPYWALKQGAGCVGPAPGGWTRVQLDRAGVAKLGIRFSLRRIRATSPRCSR